MISVIENFLEQQVYPLALELDRDQNQLKQTLLQLGEQGWLGLKIPQKFGGQDLNSQQYAQIQIALARSSGILAFVQTQHQSAGAIIAQGQNPQLKQQYLLDLTTGKILTGISFSHLRRIGSPVVRATPINHGCYQLNGVLPWITGYGLFQKAIIAAHLDTGEELYALMDFNDSPGFTISEPMEMATFQIAQTVSAKLDKFIIRPEQIIKIDSPGRIHSRDRDNVLSGAPLCLGCSLRAIEHMSTMADKLGISVITKQIVSLKQTWHELHQALMQSLAAIDKNSYEQNLQLRAKIINFMFNCVQQTIIIEGGSSNSMNNHSQRLYRETLVFAVTGQTKDIKTASLNTYKKN